MCHKELYDQLLEAEKIKTCGFSLNKDDEKNATNSEAKNDKDQEILPKKEDDINFKQNEPMAEANMEPPSAKPTI